MYLDVYIYIYVSICIYMYLYVSICIYMYLYVSISQTLSSLKISPQEKDNMSHHQPIAFEDS